MDSLLKVNRVGPSSDLAPSGEAHDKARGNECWVSKEGGGYFFTKDFEACSMGLVPRQPKPNLSRVDLKTSMVQPGMGPSDINELGLIREDIGLASTVISIDLPSSTINGSSHFSANLTKSEIEKASKAIIDGRSLVHRRPREKSQARFPYEKPLEGVWKPRLNPQKTSLDSNYYVEFPLEDGDPDDRITSTLDGEDHWKVTLKRGREFLRQPHDLSTHGTQGDCKIPRTFYGNTLDDDSQTAMAEEAGLPMPPKQP